MYDAAELEYHADLNFEAFMGWYDLFIHQMRKVHLYHGAINMELAKEQWAKGANALTSSNELHEEIFITKQK